LRPPRSARQKCRFRRPAAAATLLLLALLQLAGFLAPVAPADAAPAEPDVKAAFVLNFIKFVEWPSSAFRSADDPLVLAVVGKDPTAAAIERLDGKTVSGRRLVVRRAAGAAAVDPCHVLFIGASGKGELPALLGEVHRRPILTVADFEGFAGRGGAIGFTRQSDRIGFEINEEAVRGAGLKVNAKLLYLGRIVPAGPGGGK
jgi:hypothetical protein